MPITHAICEIVNVLYIALVFGGELPIPGPETSIASPLAHFDHVDYSTKSSPLVKAGKKSGGEFWIAESNSKTSSFFKARGLELITLERKRSA